MSASTVLAYACPIVWIGATLLFTAMVWRHHELHAEAPDPVDATTVPGATTPTVSACLCTPSGCHTTPCLTYTKEYAAR